MTPQTCGVITLRPLDRAGLRWAQDTVSAYHYLRTPVDPRCSVEGYAVETPLLGRIGLLLFGRPQATRCGDWYGGVADVEAGRCEVTRWQVLNLARVWFDPRVQHGGEWHNAAHLPGFVDRRGVWRSTLATTAIRQAVMRIGYDYLLRRPPVYLDEPYEIRWLLSYCDTRLHRGVIYQQSGFELHRPAAPHAASRCRCVRGAVVMRGRPATGSQAIETWRVRLPALTPEQDSAIQVASALNARAQRYRAQREQLRLGM